MSKSIKEFSLHYDPINESNTFTSGDIVEGRVVLEVIKEIKVDSFFVKLTGDAHVSWTEGSGDDETTYSDHERYFKLKQYFIQESSKKGEGEKNTTLIDGETYGPVISPGCHVFPFRFQLPKQYIWMCLLLQIQKSDFLWSFFQLNNSVLPGKAHLEDSSHIHHLSLTLCLILVNYLLHLQDFTPICMTLQCCPFQELLQGSIQIHMPSSLVSIQILLHRFMIQIKALYNSVLICLLGVLYQPCLHAFCLQAQCLLLCLFKLSTFVTIQQMYTDLM